MLPGRYAFGITGRGPRGGRLPRGDYVLRVLAVPVGRSAVDEQLVPFTVE